MIAISAVLSCLPSELLAQFIRMTLSLPPGFETRADATTPMVLEPAAITGSITGIAAKRAGTRWIEFRSRENSTLVISARFDNLRGGGLPQMYFLNDGTTEFSRAKLLVYRSNQVTMLDKPLMMSELPIDTYYLSAWLGVPSDRSGLLTIEFH